MNLENIQKLINEICTIDEVLPKTQLSKILPELQFGIEIEMMHDYVDYVQFKELVEQEIDDETGYYLDDDKIKQWQELSSLTLDWTVESDASLGGNGTEFISPPMSYNDFIHNIPQIVSLLKELGFYGNKKTGLHIGISSSTLNLSDKMKEDFEYYAEDLEYSDLVSTILAYNLDSRGLFAQGDIKRQGMSYSKDLANSIKLNTEKLIRYIKGKNKPEDFGLNDIVYNSDVFIEGVEEFRHDVDTNVHRVSMTRREDYIELRGLGGEEAFNNLTQQEYVKRLCVIIASQVSREPKPYTMKELYKILKPYVQDFFPSVFSGKENSETNYKRTVMDKIMKERNVIDRLRDYSYINALKDYLLNMKFPDEIKKFFLLYPIDCTYVYLKNINHLPILHNLILSNMDRIIDKLGTVTDGKLILQSIAETLKNHGATIPDETILKMAKGLSGISKILMVLPSPKNYNNLVKFLYNSGNSNDKFNAVTYDVGHDNNILSDDEIFNWADNILKENKNFGFTIQAYLNNERYKNIYDKLLIKYPDNKSLRREL